MSDHRREPITDEAVRAQTPFDTKADLYAEAIVMAATELAQALGVPFTKEWMQERMRVWIDAAIDFETERLKQ
jgi:hypothetical protein